MVNPGIVLLGGGGSSTYVVYHALKAAFGEITVILERPVTTAQLLKYRIRKLGALTVLGQLCFQGALVPLLRLCSRGRIQRIQHENTLCTDPIDDGRIRFVESANTPATMELLRSLAPKVVVVNGTRILSRKLLRSVEAPFLNMHAGITPRYRGVHGGYWALAQRDPPHCGVTVHLVDPGVDTGNVIDQALIHPTSEDNFVTYPSLQLAAGIPLMKKAVGAVLKGTLEPKPNVSDQSMQWYHPTLWGYLWRRVRCGIK